MQLVAPHGTVPIVPGVTPLEELLLFDVTGPLLLPVVPPELLLEEPAPAPLLDVDPERPELEPVPPDDPVG